MLLPPSEGKASGGRRRGSGGRFGRRLAAQRALVAAALADELATASQSRISALLGVRGALLASALETSAELTAGRPRLLPAFERYTGVVWGQLDPASLSPEERTRILVPSGLYGLTTAEDPIADYRLKLSAALPELGRLSSFWREPVTRAVASAARGGTVVEMLPAEHLAAVDLEVLGRVASVLRVGFVDRAGSRSVGHAAKAAKGAAARAVLLGGPEALDGFRFEGWTGEQVDGGYLVVAPS